MAVGHSKVVSLHKDHSLFGSTFDIPLILWASKASIYKWSLFWYSNPTLGIPTTTPSSASSGFLTFRDRQQKQLTSDPGLAFQAGHGKKGQTSGETNREPQLFYLLLRPVSVPSVLASSCFRVSSTLCYPQMFLFLGWKRNRLGGAFTSKLFRPSCSGQLPDQGLPMLAEKSGHG